MGEVNLGPIFEKFIKQSSVIGRKTIQIKSKVLLFLTYFFPFNFKNKTKVSAKISAFYKNYSVFQTAAKRDPGAYTIGDKKSVVRQKKCRRGKTAITFFL